MSERWLDRESLWQVCRWILNLWRKRHADRPANHLLAECASVDHETRPRSLKANGREVLAFA